MSTPAEFFDAGIQLHILILGLLVIPFVLLTIAALFFDWDPMAAVGSIVVGGFILIGWLISLIPYDAKYHHLYRYEAEVVSVSNVLTEGGGDLTRVPVVMTDDGIQLVVEDPRIVDLEGEDVMFTCSIEWVYQGADRYNCRILAVTS